MALTLPPRQPSGVAGTGGVAGAVAGSAAGTSTGRAFGAGVGCEIAGAADADGSGNKAGAGISILPAVAGTITDGCFRSGGKEDTDAAAGFLGCCGRTFNNGVSESRADFGAVDAGMLGVVGCKTGGVCKAGVVWIVGACVGIGNGVTLDGVACNAGMAGCTVGASAGSPLLTDGGAAGSGS